ncbi:TPA: hypothetical protein QDB40_002653 [Burkholderia vietnamiensis]|nr:hypothetical protein [Burkholderia vietnamiensis]HDR9168674.1 hypothetical protein [Burkholderia vietnamiensis]
MPSNTTPSFDDVLARLTREQIDTLTKRQKALFVAIRDADHAGVKAALRAPSPFPLVRIACHLGPHKHMSMLHLAAGRGSAEICRLLIDAGADLHAVAYDKNGFELSSLDFARAHKHRDVIRLLERESDRQGIDAESMASRVERRPDGTVSLAIVNRYTGDVLGYGRARLASDRAMNDPAVMGRVVELMTGKAIDESTLVTAVPMGGATSH